MTQKEIRCGQSNRFVEKPLVNKKFLLEKYPGKGGWTFARLPDIRPEKKGALWLEKSKGHN
jgi:hypothetical protein